ncbi:DUF4388 domain-containing protein [Polyangium spumosum]|uniref:DUF4388 domain-containing protein n=1 Tax=Polyangium spumosum TaxID=889282 RepID=A0A6N7PID1_9BACT|nr:DUF4388 domain-containing protein [Polyangium spumosum]MRG91738.1 DUF4388 domain-containing protein [Polyangium spumosum]
MTSPSRLVLRFISGKYQGGEIPLQDAQELVVGRASDAGIVLVEEMVSRRHARFLLASAELTIEDLGSTNGTFVNGEKIQKVALKEGDRVLIGTSILKVVSGDTASASRRKMEPPRPSVAPRGPARSMSGAIEEIPLPDLLQLLGSSKKSGVLVITSDDDVGKIFLHRGIVTYAEINEDDVPPLKAAIRILAWTRGTFDFDPPEDRTLPVTINLSVQELLMEGLRQIDELNALRHKLPDLDTRLIVPHPLSPPLRELSPTEIEVFQLAFNHGHLAIVLNKSQATDLDTTQAVIKLINAGYLRKG